ncbi:condensation domain-containing protein [Paenibacillus sp. BR2-3]|uniref:non-ribosomal peptide synthetase n=1 Tax=Paenibacillus sp. BR2-3 TaxID=3048494 RepID=UPI0039773A9A
MSKKYKMSTAQKRIYLVDRIQGSNITYNVPILLESSGSIDVQRLRGAVQKLVERHELLRTNFIESGSHLLQVVEESIDIPVEVRVVKKEDVKRASLDFIRPFSLSEGPLMRVLVLNMLDEGTVLLFDLHHIICDGGSIPVLFEDLSVLYGGGELPKLTVEYKHYMRWQESLDLRKQELYWHNEFVDGIPALDLFTDYPRPQQKSFQGAGYSVQAGLSLKEEVRKFCLKTRTTEFSVLLSVFLLLLSKYSGQEEILVGTPVSGRNHPDAANMLGMFVNTLVIRGQLKEDMNFFQLVEIIRAKSLNALDNQAYPFEELVERLNLPRDPSRNPLFDVMFVLQNNEKSELTLDESHYQMLDVENQVSKFDLTLSIDDTEEGYNLAWEFSTDLFRADTIERMAAHYQTLLANALAQPETKLMDLEMVSAHEKNIILEDFNATSIDYPVHRTVIDLFEEQVKQTPNAIAVDFEGKTLTYKQLNDRANYVGALLREQGVQPETIVGIVSARSLEMVIGLYGILKAGGAYLPIDPELPLDRVHFMLADCRTNVILAGPESDKLIKELPDFNVLYIQEHANELATNLSPVTAPHNLAYVIFTSGSTGKPKGVLIKSIYKKETNK